MNYVDPTGLWRTAALGYQAEYGDTLWGLSEKLFGNGSYWRDLGYPYDLKYERGLRVGDIIAYEGGLVEYENGQVNIHKSNILYQGGSYYTPQPMPEPPKPEPVKPAPPTSSSTPKPNTGSTPKPSTSSPGNGGSGGNKGGGSKPSNEKNKPGGTTLDFIDYQYDTYKIKYNNKMVMMRDIRWGSAGNIGANGCGVIAAYNVFVGLGYNLSFDQVLHQLSCMDAPLADGLLGVDPTVLFDYMKFRFKNVSLEMGGNARNWNQTALKARAVIILYKYPNMAMHYVAGIKYKRSGCFRFYNAEYLRGRNVPVGAFIGCMMAHGLQMMSMICIY